MGTFRLTDDVTALAQDITSELQIATFTNTTGRTLNVLPAISLSGIKENGQSMTVRVYVNDGTNDLGVFRYTIATAGYGETEIGLHAMLPATSSSAARSPIPLRNGLTMRITIESGDAGDKTVDVITRFLDGDAQAVGVETIGPKTSQDVAGGKTEYQSESVDDRLVLVSAYLNGLANGAANLDIQITPVDNADTYDFAGTRTYRTIKDPTTATRAILDRCGISSNPRIVPIFVRGNQKLRIGLKSSNAGDTAAGYTVYIESLETPRQSSGALAWIGNQGNGESPMKLNSGQKQYLTTGSTQDAFVLAAGRTTGAAVALAAPNAKMIHAEHFSSANLAFLVSDANNETANYKVWAVKFADTEVPKDTPGAIELQLVCNGVATAASGVPKDSGIASGYYLADTVTATWSAWFTAQLAALGLTPPDPFSPADDATPAALPIPLIFRFCNAIIIEFYLGTGAGANALIDLS